MSESTIRLAVFIVVLAAMALWETLAPRRPTVEARPRHVLRNLAIVVIDTVIVRLVVPLMPVGLAALAAERGWGLLHSVEWPPALEIAIAVLVFDLAIYGQHFLFHVVPALWRLHMVHHSDLDFDTTTGIRFHPVEILLSLGIKSGLVLVLGPAPVAVLIFEVLLNATSLFNHGNVRLPVQLDRWLRYVLVTPDMHRVHHSALRHETDSNFGFNVPWWDRLFRTYRAQPEAGHDGMTVGIETIRDVRQTTLGKLLWLPFKRN